MQRDPKHGQLSAEVFVTDYYIAQRGKQEARRAVLFGARYAFRCETSFPAVAAFDQLSLFKGSRPGTLGLNARRSVQLFMVSFRTPPVRTEHVSGSILTRRSVYFSTERPYGHTLHI